MRFIGWIIRVIQGWYNWLFVKPDKEALRRRAICKNCKFNKKNWCYRCGCYIPAKCQSKDEKCLENKW